jgi:hypothetical protein
MACCDENNDSCVNNQDFPGLHDCPVPVAGLSGNSGKWFQVNDCGQISSILFG